MADSGRHIATEEAVGELDSLCVDQRTEQGDVDLLGIMTPTLEAWLDKVTTTTTNAAVMQAEIMGLLQLPADQFRHWMSQVCRLDV